MNTNDVLFGVDYYPEHWPRDRWETDAALMRAAGFDAVRMGEFAWVKSEPEYNRICFDWLDDAIETMARNGLKVVLGTPTATPPAWMIQSEPDILPVNKEGIRMSFGGRHHVCMSNNNYRAHVERIVTALARHYRDNPAVIGWQIDNELGNSHQELCMCDGCRAKFQKWLEAKYKTIENLNESCGTVFWSQTYSNFSQIPVPRLVPSDFRGKEAPVGVTPSSHSPSLLLDWKRFCSDLIIEFQQLQIDIIRGICSGKFVTHNFMGFFDKTDYFGLAKNLDFVCNDQYPGGFWLEDQAVTSSSELAAVLDLSRGFKDGPFWIMEQQAGPTGWDTMGCTPRPGQLRLWTAHAIAHGADALFYFRWRSCLYGTEQYWHGVLPHSGIPGRRYEEISRAISDLSPIMRKTRGHSSRANVAILFSYEQNWALEIQPHHPDLDYIQQINKYYEYFYNLNIPVDFIQTHSDLSKYKLVVAPLQFLTDDGLIGKFKEYVGSGGTLVLTMRTGVKDEYNVCLSESHLPGRFGELLGIEIQDYECLRTGGVPVEIDGKKAGMAEKWCDIINTVGARGRARYVAEYYAGSPAVTENQYGDGRAFYIGFEPDCELMREVMGMVTENLDVGFILETPQGVELTRRYYAGGCYYFVLNHGDEAKQITPYPDWETVLGSDTVEPYGLTVYHQANK